MHIDETQCCKVLKLAKVTVDFLASFNYTDDCLFTTTFTKHFCFLLFTSKGQILQYTEKKVKQKTQSFSKGAKGLGWNDMFRAPRCSLIQNQRQKVIHKKSPNAEFQIEPIRRYR